MASDNIQDRGEALFNTPNPTELQSEDNKVAAKDLHISDREADIYEEGRPVDKTENSEVEPSDANDADLGDRQVIRANISGH